MHFLSDKVERSTDARPEGDIHSIDLSIRIDPKLRLRGPPPDHTEALKIISAEICPHESLREMGDRITDKIFLTYNSAIAVEVDFLLSMKNPNQGIALPRFQIRREKPSGENRNFHVKDQDKWEYRFITQHYPTITIGAAKQSIMLTLDTREVLPSVYGNERADEVTQDKEVSGYSQPQLPTVYSVYPMFGVQHDILECTRQRSYVDIQALGLDLANMAFQKADESYARNHLIEITVRGHPTNPTSKATIRRSVLERPSKLAHRKHGSFLVRLQRSEYEKFKRVMNKDRQGTDMHRVYVALGSNVGDRLSMIESACLEMSRRGINVIRTSGLYETEPMYLQDQQSFINGACEVCIVQTSKDFLLHVVPKADLHHRLRQTWGLSSF